MASEKKAFTYSCEVCGIESSDFAEYEIHIKSREHLLEIKKISETPYEGHLPQRQPRVHKAVAFSKNLTLCPACEVKMWGRNKLKEILETCGLKSQILGYLGKMTNLLRGLKPTQVLFMYSRSSIIPCTLCNVEMSGPISYQQHLEGRFHNMLLQKRMAEGSYYPDEGRSFYRPPMYLNSFPYYQRFHYRWSSSYVQGVRSPYHYYAEGYYQPLLYAAGGSRQHVSGSHSSPSRNRPYTGLFHCRLCDTHHRSWSRYSHHLSMEHKIEES